VRSHGGPWLRDVRGNGVAVAMEGLRVDLGRRVPAADDGGREVKAGVGGGRELGLFGRRSATAAGSTSRRQWCSGLTRQEGGACLGGSGADGNRAWEVGAGRTSGGERRSYVTRVGGLGYGIIIPYPRYGI
jgi:hypothetical protein